MLKMFKKNTGQKGESIAASYLSGIGYTIISRNYTTKAGEIDIIAANDGVLVFVEVKRRLTDRYGTGYEAVNYAKQAKIRAVAEQYMINKGINALCRFDVISIDGADNKITHIQNAF